MIQAGVRVLLLGMTDEPKIAAEEIFRDMWAAKNKETKVCDEGI
jgi:hypothetical protein